MQGNSNIDNNITPIPAVIEPCRFPRFEKGESSPERFLSVPVSLSQKQKIHNVFGQDGLPSAARTAWALVLGCYTGLEDVCFGYQDRRSRYPTNSAFQTEDMSLGLVIAHLRLMGNQSLEELIQAEKQNTKHAFRPTGPMSNGSRTVDEEPPFNTLVFLKSYLETKSHTKTGFPSQPSDNADLLQVSFFFFSV